MKYISSSDFVGDTKSQRQPKDVSVLLHVSKVVYLIFTKPRDFYKNYIGHLWKLKC